MNFENVYDDQRRAESYSRLEFPGTYYLAYRDIPDLIKKHVTGIQALDFGCGTGRSTRFLTNLGLKTTGIDISSSMIKLARSIDPIGDYRLVRSNEFNELKKHTYDLILSMFTFDNIPGHQKRIQLLKNLRSLLMDSGKIIMLDSTPEIYYHEWLSFSTFSFPENKNVKSGGKVKIIMKDVEDQRPVTDIIWFDNDYRDLFFHAGLNIVEFVKPLGNFQDPFKWINEASIPPWVIYVLDLKRIP